MKIYCVHGNRAPRKVAVLLADGFLVSDSSDEVHLVSATDSVQVICSLPPRDHGVWLLDPGLLRQRCEDKLKLDFVPASEVGFRPPL